MRYRTKMGVGVGGEQVGCSVWTEDGLKGSSCSMASNCYVLVIHIGGVPGPRFDLE